jgi:hypothetical protein
LNTEALKSAGRAAIVMPAVFAFADQVIGNAQTSLFAAFGSFAVLVLVEFGGLPRTRLVAYLVFAVAGAFLITLGTLCSRNAWLAAVATGAVVFVLLFAGALSGYLAAATTAAQHLDNLRRLEARLAARANAMAQATPSRTRRTVRASASGR